MEIKILTAALDIWSYSQARWNSENFRVTFPFVLRPFYWRFGIRTQIQAKGEAARAAMYVASPAASVVPMHLPLNR